jgi:hypothetical protein
MTDNTPLKFIKKGSDWLQNLYNKWTKDGSKKGFTKVSDELRRLGKLPKDQADKLVDFDEFFDDIDKATRRILTETEFVRRKI